MATKKKPASKKAKAVAVAKKDTTPKQKIIVYCHNCGGFETFDTPEKAIKWIKEDMANHYHASASDYDVYQGTKVKIDVKVEITVA